MNLYIDIDGTLITRHGEPAPFLKEFLEAATSRHDCYWLTSHCRAGGNRAEEYLRRVLPEEYWPYLDYFMPADWNTLKTEAIDFTKDFLWFDDYALEAEKEVLKGRGAASQHVHVDLRANPGQLGDCLKYLDMNLKVRLGMDVSGKGVYLDFATTHLMLLLGSTGSGKSVFHYHLYKSLVEQNTPNEIGFIFLDMTQVDFVDSDSPYLVQPREVRVEQSLLVLEELSREAPSAKQIFVHIEECNMVVQCWERTMNALRALCEKRPDVHVMYSTSKLPSPSDAVPSEMLALADTQVVFQSFHKSEIPDYLGLGRESLAQWEKLLMKDGRGVIIQPFREDEIHGLMSWELPVMVTTELGIVGKIKTFL